MSALLSPHTSRKFRFFAFLSMVLLVFVHGYNLNNRYMQPFTVVDEPMTFTTFSAYFFANGVFRFRIPILFAISGFLFALHDEKPFGKRIGNRFRTLMVPYFLWSIIGLATAVLLAQWSFTRDAVYNGHLQPVMIDNGPNQMPTWKTFDQYTPGDWLTAVLWPTSFQLWFIRCLFFYNLLYPLLKKGVMKMPAVLFTVFGLLWFLSLGFIFIEGEGLLFFTLGVWLCKKGKDIEKRPSWLFMPGILGVALAACLIKTLLAFYGPKLISDGFWLGFLMNALHKVVIAGGFLVAWYGLDTFATKAMHKKWVVKLSAYSFIIYALHVPLITYLIDPVHQLIHALPNYRLITFVLLPILVILFCIGCGWLMRKTIPGIYAVLTGNRGLDKPVVVKLPRKEVAEAVPL